MFSQTVVKECPVSRGSQGVVRMPAWLIGEVAGATHEEEGVEWLILLLGKRSKDGMIVEIEGFEVPRDQKRSIAEVDLPKREYGNEVVGVLHSHHSMSPVFSGTDNAELNPRFPMSIVVSNQLKTREGELLGFEYAAEGRISLPCGELGRVSFVIVPKGVEEWVCGIDPIWASDPKMQGVGDCSKVVYVAREPMSDIIGGSCSFVEGVVQYQEQRVPNFVFGKGEGRIISELPAPALNPVPELHIAKRGRNKRGKGWGGQNMETMPDETEDGRLYIWSEERYESREERDEREAKWYGDRRGDSVGMMDSWVDEWLEREEVMKEWKETMDLERRLRGEGK